METTVMVVGNTGVGKSSFGNRLLGFRPSQSGKPFVSERRAQPVTENLQQSTGTWFGEDPGSKLTVVDTPGLGDPGQYPERPGPLVDTENMAAAGRYLDENPVNAIVIVVGAINPRVDFTLARLIQIVVGKLHQRDYNKIVVAVNQYSHEATMVGRRVQNDPNQRTEEQIQAYIKDQFVISFEKYTDIATAPSYDAARFKEQIFLLDSEYLPQGAASDEQQFAKFRDRCMSVGEIHRDELTKGVLSVHPELQQALDALEESKQAIAAASRQHLEAIEMLREQAAAAQKASDEMHERDVEEMRVTADKLIQAMKEKGESDEALAATKRKAEEDIAAANDVHVKELQDSILKAKQSEDRLKEKIQADAEIQQLRRLVGDQAKEIDRINLKVNQPLPANQSQPAGDPGLNVFVKTALPLIAGPAGLLMNKIMHKIEH